MRLFQKPAGGSPTHYMVPKGGLEPPRVSPHFLRDSIGSLYLDTGGPITGGRSVSVMKLTNFISLPHLGQRSGSTLKKNGAKRPRFRAVGDQLFYLEHSVEIFGDGDKLVAIGIKSRIIVILHRVNTQLVITAGQ